MTLQPQSMWSKDLLSVLEKVNMHLQGAAQPHSLHLHPDLESTEGNPKRSGPWPSWSRMMEREAGAGSKSWRDSSQ